MRPSNRLFRDFLDGKHCKGMLIGWQSAAGWADALAVMEKAGLIPAGAKPEDFFVNLVNG